MSTEQNKQIVRRYAEALAANDQTTLKELLDPDLVAYAHSPNPQNREEYLQGTRMWHQAFGDTQFTIQEQIAEGDKIATRATLRAIHNTGEFQGLPPTNKEVASDGITILRILNNRIVELRVLSDWFGLMQQLGLVPPM